MVEGPGVCQKIKEIFVGGKKGIKVQLPHNEGKRIEKFIELERSGHLGAGTFGTVCKGKSKGTGVIYAVKCIQKERSCAVIQRHQLEQEIRIMTKLDHPNIIKLFETFQDSRYVYLVMEMCEGGELFDRIVEEKHLPEAVAAEVMQQVFHAVRYTHSMDIVHKDLKPQNLILRARWRIKGNCVKVIDYGIAAEWKGRMLKLKSGTPDYEAPELVALREGQTNEGYNKEVDVWACGVILYVMLSGSLPFEGKDPLETAQKIKSGELHWKGFDGVSADAKDLIGQLLVVNQHERATTDDALKHTWILNMAPNASPVGCADAVRNLQRFTHMNKLQQEALHLVARRMDDQKMEQLRQIFVKFDTKGNGTLNLLDLKACLAEAGVTDTETVQSLAQALDADNSGFIDYTEFLAASLDHRRASQEAVCWSAFRTFDQDDDGKISRKELREVLQARDTEHHLDEETINTILKDVDVDGDGFIDFNEFMKMLR
ncbi:unnamed protein product [Prorocentrum cordatum]|uniref:Non-specific serine/threonine protein kinase n=1 Tax=Prorocentrum cordatum TaxID=2364126 RepID=A0ABN9TDH2_9DINO|nr:unnamed protein product [Polarella glacialis]